MAKVQHIIRDLFLHPIKTFSKWDRSINKSKPVAKWLTKRFHKLYYTTPKRTWENTTWLGTMVLKCPLDLWLYQEIIHKTQPDLIIECGTASGGSTAFLASMLDLIGKGKVVSLDICDDDLPLPQHERITYIRGVSSVAPDAVDQVREHAKGCERIMAIFDSDHSRDHVYAELHAYADIVTPGCYMIVEDSNQNGHPVSPFFGPGPFEAIHDFLKENKDFEIDREQEKFYLSFNPDGYLKKLR